MGNFPFRVCRKSNSALARLSAYRIAEADFPRIVANARGASMKTNSVLLPDEEITRILTEQL